MKSVYECYIRTLSPLHVGCDEVYEPMGFVVDEPARELIAFDPVEFISGLDSGEKKRFSGICAKGTVESILEIYKFLKGKPALGKRVQLCAGFVSHYNKTLGISTSDKRKIQQELSRFAISRTSFLSGDGRPYIPGSAVKGALRTAYLNRMASKNPMPTPRGKYAATDLEKKLLSYDDLSADPFRLVKTSDFMPVGDIGTRIVYAVDIKKSTGAEAKGPYQILETVLPGAVFRGSVTVETPVLSSKTIQEPIQLKALLNAGQAFFAGEFTREKLELQTAGLVIPSDFFNPNALPIRIGRHSGAESVTIEGHRKIKILAGKGKQPLELDHATTIWLASESARPNHINECRPFGWAEILPLNDDAAGALEALERERISRPAPKDAGAPLETISASIDEKTAPPATMAKVPEPETWEKAHLAYAPNTKTITAKWEGKTARTRDISLVPDIFKNKLFGKKKAVIASVKAELIGGKEYRLIKISE